MTDIVSREWVTDASGDLHIVDVRDAWEYEGIGHIPGAVNIPFDSFRSSEGDAEGMLPDTDPFAALLGEAGISEDAEIVAYDDMHGVFAARFLVTCELLGHDPAQLHLLDGDFSAWQQHAETIDEEPAIELASYTSTDPAETPLVEAETVASALDAPDNVIVDTREDREYEEGHLPGATLLDWMELVDEETRGILPRDEALAVLDDHGITPDKRVVLYCNTARRISHTYVVLRDLGFDDVAFFEGSLTAWNAEDRPLETGRPS
jgi:thiosulfate/3-mercaptopyruvate sulfurtransferase